MFFKKLLEKIKFNFNIKQKIYIYILKIRQRFIVINTIGFFLYTTFNKLEF